MRIDELIDALNETGVPFVRDAWVEAPAGDYGVVSMEGEPMALWGDDHMVAQRCLCSVYLYSRDGRDDVPAAVNAILNASDVIFAIMSREYLPDLNMIRWQWRVTLEQYFG